MPEPGGGPVDELDRPLGLDRRDGRVHILRDLRSADVLLAAFAHDVPVTVTERLPISLLLYSR